MIPAGEYEIEIIKLISGKQIVKFIDLCNEEEGDIYHHIDEDLIAVLDKDKTDLNVLRTLSDLFVENCKVSFEESKQRQIKKFNKKKQLLNQSI